MPLGQLIACALIVLNCNFCAYLSFWFCFVCCRYFALHHYGGIYLDVDVECLQPFYNFTLEHSCFVSQEPVEHPHFLNRMDEPLVSNALMGCRPGHPFFKYVIRHLSDYTGWLFWTDILKATGPFMLTQALKSFRNSNSHQQSVSKHDSVRLIDDRIFQPTIDDSMLRHIVEKCRRPIEKRFPSAAYRAQHATLCSKLLSFQYANIPGADSITNHHWTHLWGGRRYDPWGAFNTDIGFDIRQLAVLRNLSVASPWCLFIVPFLFIYFNKLIISCKFGCVIFFDQRMNVDC